MKIRVIALLLLVAMLSATFCSCALGDGVKLVNTILGFFIPNDDITNISFNFQIPDPNRCTTHAIVPLIPIAPTCQTPGVAGGQVCQNCGVVIVPQIELPVIEHTYDNVMDKDCNHCGFVREVKCEHTETRILEAKAPTCVTTGRTRGEECVGCGKIVAGCEIVEPVNHTYDDRDDDTCNVCSYVRKLACPHEITNKLNKVEPTCSTTGLTQGIVCGHCGEVLLPQQVIPTIDHIEGDWIVDLAPTEQEKGTIHTECTVCATVLKTGELDVIVPEESEGASQGLSFELNPDGNSYILVDIGDCTDVDIVIPRYYNGKPVTKIGDGAFMNNGNINSVVIPEGVLNIGKGAFRECVALKTVVLSNTVTSIGEYAFYNCALTSLSLPYGLTEIKQYSFYACDFTKLEIPYGVVSVGNGAFAECTLVNELILPATLEVIGKEAFYNIASVTSITLPRYVHSIGDKAFNISAFDEAERTITMYNYVEKIGAYAFVTNTEIIYKGTRDEWNAILIDPRNYQYNVKTLNGEFVD